MKKFALLLLLAAQAFAGSPVLWGPNNQAINLQNQFIHATGALAKADGAKNYIAYGNFENNATTGWSLGNVSLTSGLPTGVPTFGSGADSHLSLSVSSTSGISSRSLVYSTSTATVAGDFVASQAYTIDNGDQAKVLQIKFAYEVFSGITNAATNFNLSGTSSNSFGVAIYDVTNSAWIIPAGVWNVIQGTGAGIYTGTFQTPVSMTQFRLVLFNANATTGTGSTLWLDSFFTGPQITAMGPADTDMTAFTPTGSWSTNTTYTGWWWRHADKMGMVVKLALAGAPTSASLTVNLPSGITLDTTKLPATPTNQPIGKVTGQGAAHTFSGVAFYSSTTAVAIDYTLDGNTASIMSYAAVTQAAPYTFANNDFIYIYINEIPVSGWSSNTVMSNDTDTRVIAATATGTATGGSASGTTIVFPTVQHDTTASYNASTGVYTCPVTGVYDVYGFINASNTGIISLYRNTVLQWGIGRLPTGGEGNFTGSIKCNAGDTLNIAPDSNVGAFGSNCSINFSRKSGPAVVSAAESVNARYFASATAISGSLATVSWTTKDYDSHNGMSSGTYTIPVTGKYQVNSGLLVSGTFALNSTTVLEIQKNGTAITRNKTFAGGVITDSTAEASDIISCVAGDTIRVQVSTSATGPAIVSDNFANFFSITRVGN